MPNELKSHRVQRIKKRQERADTAPAVKLSLRASLHPKTAQAARVRACDVSSRVKQAGNRDKVHYSAVGQSCEKVYLTISVISHCHLSLHLKSSFLWSTASLLRELLLDWSTQMTHIKAQPHVQILGHNVRAQFPMWVHWQTWDQQHPSSQYVLPMWSEVLQIFLATGKHRVMQSLCFMTAELIPTDKTKVSKVEEVFILRITFHLHTFVPLCYIFLRATVSTHVSKTQISNSSQQEWAQKKNTASAWYKNSLLLPFISLCEFVLSKHSSAIVSDQTFSIPILFTPL